MLDVIGIACRMLTDLGLHELMCEPRDQNPAEKGCLAYTLASGCLGKVGPGVTLVLSLGKSN